MRSLVPLFLLGGALAGCGDDAVTPPGGDPPDPAATYSDPDAVSLRLSTTLADLAALGNKRAGSAPGAKAAEYLEQRMTAAGLKDVHFESFRFPDYSISASTLAVSAAGVDLPMKHDVFAYSGVGAVDAEIVDLGKGRATDYEGKDVTGKVVMVVRDPSFHRSSQYKQVVDHGGAAMLYVSTSPENLIQIGTVADPEDGAAPIPAITVGSADGAQILTALEAGKVVTAALEVEAEVALSEGRNVIGRLEGTSPGGEYLLVGAHFDTWYAGSADNGTGVAAMLEVMEAFAHRPDRKLGLVFVGYDGEELGLFGGYDYLRDHVVVGKEPMLAFLNFEMPAAGDTGLRGLAFTNDGPIDPALVESDASTLYELYVGMEVVPAVFGGIIPTDIQGMYWSGLQGMSTACDSPYYHTTEDTPDKLDMPFLTEAVLRFEDAIALLDASEAEAFRNHDGKVWKIEAELGAADGGVQVDVLVTDAIGTPKADAVVRVWLDVDDFTRVFLVETKSDASGKATATVPAEAVAEGTASRWLHVTAGETYPLAERVLPVN